MDKNNNTLSEVRKTAAQRMWDAENKQRAKSDASNKRTPSSIPVPDKKLKSESATLAAAVIGGAALMRLHQKLKDKKAKQATKKPAKPVKQGVAEANYQHTDGHAFNAFKAELETKHGKGNVKIDGDGNVADAYHVKTGKHLGFIDGSHAEVNEQSVAEGASGTKPGWMLRQDPVLGSKVKAAQAKQKEFKKLVGTKVPVKDVKEAKDPREYDYEGDMAKSQLRSIIANAQRAHDMLEDDTNMAEWVQSKITLAADYISTVADYMQSEVNEEAKKGLYYYVNKRKEAGTSRSKNHPDAPSAQDWKDAAKTAKEEVELSELNKDTLYSYTNKANTDITKRHSVLGKQIKADKSVEANKNAAKISNRLAGMDRAETRLNKEETEQVNELKKSTLGSYIKKAADSATMRAYGAGGESTRHAGEPISKRPDTYGADRKVAIKRLKGIDKATDRLTRESKTFLDIRKELDERNLTPVEKIAREELSKMKYKKVRGAPTE